MVLTACTLLFAQQLSNSPQIRTGDTPKQMPGTNGWLPSGKGKDIPATALVDGKPVGMWWTIPSAYTHRKGLCATVFFADGTMMQSPILGGGKLLDMKVKKLTTVAAVSNTTIRFFANGNMISGPFISDKDEQGVWVDYCGDRYRPCLEPTPDKLVGTWSISGLLDIRFAKNGQVAHALRDGENSGSGTWVLDGYLVAIDRGKDDYIVNSIFMIDANSLVIGNQRYYRTQ